MDLLYRLFRSFMDEPFRNEKAFLNPLDPDSPTPLLGNSLINHIRIYHRQYSGTYFQQSIFPEDST